MLIKIVDLLSDEPLNYFEFYYNSKQEEMISDEFFLLLFIFYLFSPLSSTRLKLMSLFQIQFQTVLKK